MLHPLTSACPHPCLAPVTSLRPQAPHPENKVALAGCRQECQQFHYGGCLGNRNKFLTKHQCIKACVYKLDNPVIPGSAAVLTIIPIPIAVVQRRVWRRGTRGIAETSGRATGTGTSTPSRAPVSRLPPPSTPNHQASTASPTDSSTSTAAARGTTTSSAPSTSAGASVAIGWSPALVSFSFIRSKSFTQPTKGKE